jgi:hypothetical protein
MKEETGGAVLPEAFVTEVVGTLVAAPAQLSLLILLRTIVAFEPPEVGGGQGVHGNSVGGKHALVHADLCVNV